MPTTSGRRGLGEGRDGREMPLNRMLMPLGLEPRDERMLAFACALTTQGVRELLVAHVVDASGQEAPVIMHEVERARERLLAMVEPYRTCDMKVEVRVVTGSVLREISALAHQAHVDVICCGTQGKSFVDYLFAGSVSEDLALKGDERTMTVRYDLFNTTEEAAQVARDFAKRLVVPTDFSASAMRAVLSAFDRSPQALGEVHLLHVTAPDDEGAEAQLKGLAAIGAEQGVNVVTELRDGDPKEAVLGYVREIAATGVITGRQGRSSLGRGILGSVSMHLMQDAPCPVVIQP
ncbi:MAG: universal stress protein [Actinobacteria bacterium]|nr:MAG: universal stress protein [Actinomycetota bacterium]